LAVYVKVTPDENRFAGTQRRLNACDGNIHVGQFKRRGTLIKRWIKKGCGGVSVNQAESCETFGDQRMSADASAQSFRQVEERRFAPFHKIMKSAFVVPPSGGHFALSNMPA
jgi:hypothetical protein